MQMVFDVLTVYQVLALTTRLLCLLLLDSERLVFLSAILGSRLLFKKLARSRSPIAQVSE